MSVCSTRPFTNSTLSKPADEMVDMVLEDVTELSVICINPMVVLFKVLM